MKKKYYLFLLILLLSSFTGAEIPELNQRIVDYVQTVIGKQVDRGECWDLAFQALNRNNAEWDGQFEYGKRLNPDKDRIFPGDIIQFKNVKITYSVGQMIYKEQMDQHTAIIYKVKGESNFDIAHQNNSFSGRKVGVSSLDLKTIVRGKIYIYRPVPSKV